MLQDTKRGCGHNCFRRFTNGFEADKRPFFNHPADIQQVMLCEGCSFARQSPDALNGPLYGDDASNPSLPLFLDVLNDYLPDKEADRFSSGGAKANDH